MQPDAREAATGQRGAEAVPGLVDDGHAVPSDTPDRAEQHAEHGDRHRHGQRAELERRLDGHDPLEQLGGGCSELLHVAILA